MLSEFNPKGRATIAEIVTWVNGPLMDHLVTVSTAIAANETAIKILKGGVTEEEAVSATLAAANATNTAMVNQMQAQISGQAAELEATKKAAFENGRAITEIMTALMAIETTVNMSHEDRLVVDLSALILNGADTNGIVDFLKDAGFTNTTRDQGVEIVAKAYQALGDNPHYSTYGEIRDGLEPTLGERINGWLATH